MGLGDFLDRLPPQDLTAEQQVLGCVLLQPSFPIVGLVAELTMTNFDTPGDRKSVV